MKKDLITTSMKPVGFFLVAVLVTATKVDGQVGINTTTPQATLDVRGNQRFGGKTHFMTYDSVSGKIGWNGSNLFVPAPQYLIQHSASAEGLYYGNSQLEYRYSDGTPRFYTNWSTGNGYFAGKLGIGNAQPNFPLSFGDAAGDKISLWSNSAASYGFGIQSYLLQVHTDVPEADIAFGYGSSAAFTENFRLKGNGALAVKGNAGAPGQVLVSNGNASPSWTDAGSKHYFFRQTGATIDLSTTIVNIPGINGATFTTDYLCNLIVTTSAEIQMNPGEPQQSVLVYTNIKDASNTIIGSSVDYVLMKAPPFSFVKGNATATIFIGNDGNVAPGTYTIACSVQRLSDSNTGNSTCFNTQVIVQAVPQ